jgi:hypothetical protein
MQDMQNKSKEKKQKKSWFLWFCVGRFDINYIICRNVDFSLKLISKKKMV